MVSELPRGTRKGERRSLGQSYRRVPLAGTFGGVRWTDSGLAPQFLLLTESDALQGHESHHAQGIAHCLHRGLH
jgi:hypothetical protein